MELAQAVCLKAVDDYRDARYFIETKQKSRPLSTRDKKTTGWLWRKNLSSAIDFMKSPLFEVYSGLDGPSVLKRLKDECDRGIYGLKKKGGGYGKR